MKKILVCAVMLIGALSSCSILSAPVDAVVNEAGFTVTNVKDGGTFEVASGQKAIRNVAVVLNSNTKVTLTKAPDNSQCATVNSSQIYCRLGDFTPFTTVSAKFSGHVDSAKLGYINADGETKTIDAKTLSNP